MMGMDKEAVVAALQQLIEMLSMAPEMEGGMEEAPMEMASTEMESPLEGEAEMEVGEEEVMADPATQMVKKKKSYMAGA